MSADPLQVNPMERIVHGLEHEPRLDGPAGRLRHLADRTVSGARGAWLRGETIGHALHPLLTDLPVGCWTSAALLDLVGGRAARPAARRLVALGLLAVPATAATGLADWHAADDRATARVGTVHAATNTVTAVLYALSWRARRRGHHVRGVALGALGGVTLAASGHLGGHLAFGRPGARDHHDTAATATPPSSDRPAPQATADAPLTRGPLVPSAGDWHGLD